MSYSLNIELKEQYLHVTVSGENTLANVLSYLEEAYEACIKHRCSNVLIEKLLTGPNLDTFDIFVVISKNFNKAKTISLRLAYVDMNTKHIKRELKFAENLAHIRGVNVRFFYGDHVTTQEAVTWLLDHKTNHV
ncbi:MAG: hypothetical protein Q8L88_11470 [Bacteroidota bacterium]|nr:hypothetical protein [Bacteroidota bacterium]